MKHLTGFLALFLFAVLPLSAADLSDLTYTTTNGEVTITDCRATAGGELIIPDTIAGYPVTSIEDAAFLNCTSLTSITIPDSVTSIGIDGISLGVFRGCSSLTEITIPNSITRLEADTFWGCSALTSITIPNSVISIGSSTFFGCSGLTEITIPNTVASIGDGAFASCTSLTAITIPDSITEMGSYTFENCESLTEVTFGSGITAIPPAIFRNCTGLTSITVPAGVNSIGAFAFLQCSSLSRIVFTGPAPVTVGVDAFAGVASDAIVVVEAETRPSFGFIGTNWNGLIVTCNSGDLCRLNWTTINGEVTITDCDPSATGELVIPDTIEGDPVTSIGEFAFWRNTGLTRVIIPNGVTNIGYEAFSGCNSLTEMTIPDSVTSIGGSAFLNCTSLTSITIPDSVTSIGIDGISLGVFRGCSSLTEITIPNSITRLEADTFWGCSALTSITIPNSVISIGSSTFFGCSGLTEITIPNTVASIGDGAFASCTSLTAITIPDSITEMGSYTFENCESLTEVTFGSGITAIPPAIFRNCTGLTSITVPAGVNSIGAFAFLQCSSLSRIVFTGPAPVTVGVDAFAGVASDAIVVVEAETRSSFGAIGATWNGLLVTLSGPIVTVDIVAGQGTIESPVGPQDLGTRVTITATPELGYTFVGWSGDFTGTANPLVFEQIENDLNIRALFLDLGTYGLVTIADSEASAASARSAGQGDVTNNPEAFNLVTQENYEAIRAERDARPTAGELASVEAERDARPTADQLAAVEAERDARPTTEALVTVEEERDAIMTDIQLAYDEVVGRKGAAEEDLIAVAPTSSATIFDLVWTNSGDPADTIEMTIEFPEGTVANPVELDFGTSIQGSILTIDYQETVTVINDPSIAFESPVELDFSQELMGQNGFGATAGSPGSGDFNLFQVEVPEGRFSGQNYFTLGAPDGSEYILTSMLAPVTSRFSSLELNPLTELYASLVATNEDAIAERDAAIAERDARPTTEELAAVEAERDARYTEDQIRALSADYTIGLNAAGNVQMKFNLFESADLNTFAPLTVNPDSVSVVDGSICLELTPEDRAAFFRFSVE